jgi:hypothetical protein
LSRGPRGAAGATRAATPSGGASRLLCPNSAGVSTTFFREGKIFFWPGGARAGGARGCFGGRRIDVTAPRRG